MCEFFSKTRNVRAKPKIALHANNQPSSSFFNQLCHIRTALPNIYYEMTPPPSMATSRCIGPQLIGILCGSFRPIVATHRPPCVLPCRTAGPRTSAQCVPYCSCVITQGTSRTAGPYHLSIQVSVGRIRC